jgi:hypothetical protein
MNSAAEGAATEKPLVKEKAMTDESVKQRYCLIRGGFLPDEARQVLLTLIDDKIRYHMRNDWSSRERLGEADTAGRKRVAELKQAKADLMALLAEAESAGMKLTINCNIDIEMAPQ